jgi:phage host-nuclease inhibitor protein Gam
MNELIKNYQNNCDEWNNLYAQQQEIGRKFDKKIRDIKDKYQDQIRKIESKMYDEIGEIDEEQRNKIDEIQREKDAIVEKLNQAREIFKYICLYTDNPITKTPDVFVIRYGIETSFNPIITIRDDNYCKAYLYIITNNKPVNKYSLIMVGSCPVLEPDRDTINNLYSYGIDAHTKEKGHIMLKIKDDHSEKYLREYAQKNIKRITNLLSIVDEKIAKYQQAIEIFQTTEGKIAFYNWRKDYYEKHYCNGTETPEYKAVLKKLKQLKG